MRPTEREIQALRAEQMLLEQLMTVVLRCDRARCECPLVRAVLRGGGLPPVLSGVPGIPRRRDGRGH